MPASLAQGSGRLIFALWAQNARPPGPLARTLRSRAVPALRARRSGRLIGPFGPNARPPGPLARTLRSRAVRPFRPPGVPVGLLGHSAQTLDLQGRCRAPCAVALCQLRWPRVPAGLFSPFGLKTLGLQGLRPLRSRPVPALLAQGSGWLIFALWAQNAQPPGASPPSQSPRATFAGPAFRLAYWAVRPKRSAFRGAVAPPSPSPCASFAGPGFRPAYWAIRPKRSASRGAVAPPSQAPHASFAGPAFRLAYFRPLGSKRSASRGFAPFAGCPRSLRGHLRAKMRSALLPLRMFFPRVRQSLRRVRGSPLWGSPLRRPSR